MKNRIDRFRATTAMFFAAALLAGCGAGGRFNSPPVANAGSVQNVTIGALVTLGGSASTDADNNRLTYSWTLTSKPTGSSATLAGATTLAPTFTADVGGTYVTSLVVNDGLSNSTPATVSINAYPAGAGYVVQGGLIWMPVTVSDTWANADVYCANFSVNGLSGWRMPTRPELSALYASGAMIGQGWVLAGTWTSSPYNAGYHYFIDLNYGTDTWMPDVAAILISCVH